MAHFTATENDNIFVMAQGDVLFLPDVNTLTNNYTVSIIATHLAGTILVTPENGQTVEDSPSGYSLSATGQQQILSFKSNQDTDNWTLVQLYTLDVPSNAADTNLAVIFDGGGSTLTSGTEVIIRVPADMTLEGVTLIADQTGSIILDVLKSTFAGYPTMSTIVAAAPPTISAADKSQDNTLTGWTTSLLEGDLLKVMINGAVTSIVTLSINLHGVRV